MMCLSCKSHHLYAGVINHVVEREGKITIVKNVPAMVCRQCGEGYIDHKHALRLEEMVRSARVQGMELVIINYSEIAA